MKVIFIIIAVVGVLFLGAQLYLGYSMSKIENQPYNVIKKGKDIEVRFYPSVKIAAFTSSNSSYKSASSNGFRKLAGYIFGGNEKSESIAMTSPVQMDLNDSGSTMQFMMPSIYSSKKLPTPKDANVRLTTTEDEYVAAISFSGFANDEVIEKYSKKLAEILVAEKLKPIGNYRYLGYNPPYQLIGRRNEVIVRVSWAM